ncbi:bifunctional 2-polyprenyl-6-hydroxyphenol methylase/3-demethylubiquinol 3-O-methyltransferase UbiG [Acidisphaera sp. L21]|uniref:class I SAM-dependent methyltransferase n=1 Tax=Acidisphaera sp. L21 TaxID=1641851 RepID=UPI0020B112A5|nr:class I SAM-dependent methyltransferase [Acidisphaera sp. L21]
MSVIDKPASKMLITAEHLDAFVAQSDAFGGPGSPACAVYWSRFEYRPGVTVDQTIDPYGETYVQAQLALYEEIAGRSFNQATNEHTPFDVSRHVAAVNPYDHADPSALAVHTERLSRAFRLAKLPRDGRLLDLGCGWGLSSEIGAYLGLKVTAVDINPLFVNLVNQRAELGRRAITATTSSFDDFDAPETYDMVLFYECLHHALKPWDVIEKFRKMLAPGGKIVLTGEPINKLWWRHWGIRLDPISVYCVRKFGWFESGWSLDFIREVFRRAGMKCIADRGSDEEIGYTLVAQMSDLSQILATEMAEYWDSQGFTPDAEYLVFSGHGWLEIPFAPDTGGIRLILRSFRPAKGLATLIRIGQTTVFEGMLPPGDTVIDIQAEAEAAHVEFDSEVWCPDKEVYNGDKRQISFHVVRAIVV